jgi:hypothetical protein
MLAVGGLVLATVGERVMFKLAVDRMFPFRIVLVQLIVTSSLVVYGVISLVKQGLMRDMHAVTLPRTTLWAMAVVDTVGFAGLTVAAAGVSPAMTVVLLHASTPCMVLGAHFYFPDRKYTPVQMRGVGLIALAVVAGVGTRVATAAVAGGGGRPETPDALAHSNWAGALSTLTYAIMAGMQGLATLFKEREIAAFAQPMDIHYLTSALFMHQTAIALVLAPVGYFLQGLAGGYPLTSYADNLVDGLACYIGDDPNYADALYDHSQATDCGSCFVLIAGYVMCGVVVLECVDHLVQLNHQLVGRALAAAVAVAALALGALCTPVPGGVFGSALGYSDVAALAVLLVGLELYAHDPEPDATALTSFVPVPVAPVPLLKTDSLTG